METKTLKLDNQANPDNAIKTGIELLAKGQVVAFPTETVYGVAARADIDRGWDSLTAVKQRPLNKPFTSHVGQIKEIYQLVPLLSERHKLFIKKTLPGPLTIVFELNDKQIVAIKEKISEKLFNRLYFNNSIGIRLPGDKVARTLLSQAGGPIVASSANSAGMAPAYTAEQTADYLNEKISLILDNGPSRIQKPSTVVKISNNDIEIIREGIIDKRMINKALEIKILFVCTGNTCRSPMAEGFGRSMIAKKIDCSIDQLHKKGYHIGSAGVMAIDGYPASSEAVLACKSFSVDINNHRSRLLSEDMIKDADYILAMSPGHYRSIVSLVPNAAEKTELLAPEGVDDPFGRAQNVYDSCARQINNAVEKFVNKLGLD